MLTMGRLVLTVAPSAPDDTADRRKTRDFNCSILTQENVLNKGTASC